MNKEVKTLEAKTQLSQLLRRVAAGEEITIANRGVPMERLVPIHTKKLHRKLGMFEGKFVVLDDLDTPLPDEILQRGGETQAELTCRIGL